jgi:hypothetical protein
MSYPERYRIIVKTRIIGIRIPMINGMASRFITLTSTWNKKILFVVNGRQNVRRVKKNLYKPSPVSWPRRDLCVS